MILMYAVPDDSPEMQELQQILGVNKEQIYEIYNSLISDKTINLAGNIFDKYLETINPEFKKLMEQKFNFVPEKLQSVEQVNQWCNKHTNGKIQKIISDINFDTLIISAIHFKDQWVYKFSSNNTHQMKFNRFQGDIQKDFMYQQLKANTAKYFSNNDIQMIQLAYEQSQLQAVIILPRQNNQEQFNKSLSIGIENMNKLDEQYSPIKLYLPKFKIESTFQLKEALNNLGINKIFKHVSCLQTLGKPMKVDQIIQKTFINTDEQGTEAAAVTGIMMMRTSCGAIHNQPIVMNCNHPFWFLLVDRDYNILFASSYVQ